MEICFEKKCVDIFAERLHQVKSDTETVETVVPDTNDDIARVASLRSFVMLKGKEISARGVNVTGELRAWLLYITEGGAVQSVQLSREFSMEYETDAVLDEKLTQVKLCVNAAETRVLNPRKVAVTFEICGELWSYTREELCVSASIDEAPCRIYTRYDQQAVTPIVGVTEKTFALTEQFAFPDGKPSPGTILAQGVDYAVGDIQIVGSRAIIKGSAFITVCYVAEDIDYPLTAEFTCQFSQLIDVPDREICGCAAQIQTNGAYFNVIDTINGTKALDAELHCLTELVCFGSETVSYLADAYCNTAGLDYRTESFSLPTGNEVRIVPLSFNESIEAPEDCADILAAFTQLSRSAVSGGTITSQCLVDMIYRSESGGISVMKRTFELEGDCPENTQGMIYMRITDAKLYPTGGSVSVSLNIEAVCLCRGISNISAITSMELADEVDSGFAEYPSVTLVRSDGETLWQLAKGYRSSEEVIAAVNGCDCTAAGDMLLIPKTK